MIKPKSVVENLDFSDIEYCKKDYRLKLDLNENIYGASSLVQSIIKNFKQEDISLYPNYSKLIDKISEKFNVKKNNVLITAGSSEAIKTIIETYLEKDDKFFAYNTISKDVLNYCKLENAKINLIDYDEKFVFNENKIIQNADNDTKMIYLSTPDKITGELIKPIKVRAILNNFKNTLVVVDCSYINFSDSDLLNDFIDLLNEYDNLIIIKSFSNDYALATLRCAFVVSNNLNIENLKKVILPYSVSSPAINCAVGAVNDEKRFEEIKNEIIKSREEFFKGLLEAGFNPYPSDANFILTDFGDYCGFYYNKLKNNGVLTKKFEQNQSISTCLRITVPKISGAKYIYELLKPKKLLVFDLDDVVFDISDSLIKAILKTFNHFCSDEISVEEIKEVKTRSSMNCNWEVVKYLLEKRGYNIELSDIINVFQNIFFNPLEKNKEYLIDEEKLLLSKEILEELNKTYDLVICSDRLKEEVFYSLKKFDIEKYFYYFITSDDIPKTMLKPHPKGLLEIKRHCPYLDIFYFGNNVDDIIAGNMAEVKTVGVLSPNCDFNSTINNFKHTGANYILEDVKKILTFLKDK